MATVASGANSQVAHIREETIDGTTHAHTAYTFGVPPTPTATYQPLTTIPFVSCSLDQTRGVLADNSITSNRQRQAQRLGNITAAGSLSTVLRASVYDWLLENMMLNTFASDVLKVGTQRIGDSIEVGFKNIGQYRVFSGIVVNQAVFNIPTNGVATAQFNLMGTSTSQYGTSSIGAGNGLTVEAPTFEGLTHLSGQFLEGGVDRGVFTSLQLTVSNNFEQTYTLGHNEVHDVVPGDLAITGQLVAYFEDATFANKFIQETPTSLQFKLIDTHGNYLQFFLPAVRYTGAQTPIQNSGPVSLTMPFEASYSAGSDLTTMTITRHLV